jgi:predicted  nucleic acid-binding Zn-ribbon protein
MADTSEFETVNYRLEKIENSIEELRKVLVDSRVQSHDIEDMKSDIIRHEGKIDKLENKVQELELKPTKEKADKWQYILDYIFKTLVALAIGAFLIKLGIK